jgi:NADPH:quinone reductase-like Zn-dependent oxidoreductase
VGDEVYASLPGGGAYAEAITLPATLCSHKPAALSHVEAAAVAGAVQTAWQALFDQGNLEAGQRVLIHGASGGVGTLAVQLARWQDATVIATASAEHREFVRDLGADEVIDSRDPGGLARVEPVDLLIDAVGGPEQGALFALVKLGGRLVALTQPPPPEEARTRGLHAGMLLTRPSGDTLRAFEEALAAGAVRPVVDQTFPLSEAAQAWGRQARGGVRGKLVLTLSPEAGVRP